MIRTTIIVAALVLLSACTATHERPMNKGEQTIASKQVLAMLDAEGGTIDTRETEKVKCVRNRLVGTHRVTRVCYTLAEYKTMIKKNQDAYYENFGASKCLSRETCRNRPLVTQESFGRPN
jgi:hypothetical protein